MSVSSPRPVRGVPAALLAAVLLAGAIGALALGPAGAASASLGSVPDEVAAYVADGGMTARLADVYGKDAAGAGLDVDDTTKAGPISRVYEWTSARLSGVATDHPVQLTNNWVVPLTIAGKPVGLATIWINPQSVEPELADFTATPRLATALAEVPATAALVRDPVSHAWLALQDGTVTPLIAGTSGLTGPVPVASLKLSATAAPATVPTAPNPTLGIAIGVVGLVVVIVVVALLVPRRRRPAGETDAADAGAADAGAADAVAGAAVAGAAVAGAAEADAGAAPPVVAGPLSAEPAAPKPASAAVPRVRAKASTPVTKPTVSKRGGRAPGATTSSTKPPAQKPPAQKPSTQKPPTRKPPARKPPRPPAPPSEQTDPES